MATINNLGNVKARCPACDGALVTFEWRTADGIFGALSKPIRHRTWEGAVEDHRLFRCAGCGHGALGIVVYAGTGPHSVAYPGAVRSLVEFYPEAKERLDLPDGVPDGIANEFREGERCLEANCLRAAAAMFRSVLDKTLRANGYKEKKGTTLEQQIDMACKDRVVTASRQRKAHEDIRVLGNDVLHDEWHEIAEDDVLAARHYAQRILEDLYDDRETVLALLKEAGREAHDTEPPEDEWDDVDD